PTPQPDARLTFASFIASPGAQLALTAARAVAENPVLAYNPLFIYGAAGLGKTHLLHAVGNGALARRPELRVAYLRAAALADELGDEADRATLAARLARYSSLDVLLLDDAHALVGRPAQKHVLLLLETLVAGGKQVVCAAGAAPRAIPGLDDRMRAFLQSGLVADLGAPDDEVRLAILRAKAQLRAGTADRPARRRATPQHVLDAVFSVFGVPVDDLLAPRRDKHVVTARQVAMHLMREETGASLAEIGAALGGRDHSTVLHGCDKVARALEVDGTLREHVATARDVLRASVGGGSAAAAHLDSA
ncbi:MAG TPA: DnaA/Hda family protein, partial [Chloroflexota bacterium]|nr:DnaA/Hda family protein [Chloroflexota bacterium]